MRIRLWAAVPLLVLVVACGDGPPANPGNGADSGTPGGERPDGGTSGTNPDGGSEPPPLDGGVIGGTDRTVVTYAGNDGLERFESALVLSDGTVLVAGGATSLDWVPPGVPRTQLSAATIQSVSGANIGFILHLSADLRSILRVVHFPQGSVRNIQRLRATGAPGQPTGDLYLSGIRDVPADVQQEGYFIARLDHNFVTAPPTAVRWTYDVKCPPRQASGYTGESEYKHLQPWDVGGDGKVVYALGAEYDFKWAALERLTADGKQDLVPEWTAHWTAAGAEFDGLAADYTGGEPLVRSAIVMKAGRKGSLRSTTQADFDVRLPDGNGRTDRKGRFPDDYYFTGPCTAASCSGTGPGYTGYRLSDKPTQRVGSIAIDRRNNHLYFGYSTQSRLPDGNPDFEPAVVAMEPGGRLRWWSRLYHEQLENNGALVKTSSPDQYVDHVAIDYAANRLVVLARAHGNNVINFWSGNKVASHPGATSFHHQFTGTSGNIHISWLAKLAQADGTLAAASWVAEYSDGATLGTPYAEPLHDGWGSHNAGWPDLNTTRVSALEVDARGAVYLAALGRRTVTTSNAYMKMYKPSQGRSAWNHFVRVFEPDLKALRYSSLLRGPWDPAVDGGGENVLLEGVFPVRDGVLVTGWHTRDSAGVPLGAPLPVAEVPAWGSSTPAGESAVLAHLRF
ncbi:MAG TPA: hypothetical protein VFZ09_41975 [Archangium sp.]|uniref:hypothetical protein n=1 Tax=Archangium sp. TaxID=1872627 RepID=UPI002E36C9D1|nr:hypothetical protein [Archangium sp.]HEX5752847.1 hypothetical protein [Archangium sp.]